MSMGLIKSEIIKSGLQNLIDLLESRDQRLLKTTHQATDIAMALNGDPDFDSEEQFNEALKDEQELVTDDLKILKRLISDTTFSTDQLLDD